MRDPVHQLTNQLASLRCATHPDDSFSTFQVGAKIPCCSLEEISWSSFCAKLIHVENLLNFSKVLLPEGHVLTWFLCKENWISSEKSNEIVGLSKYIYFSYFFAQVASAWTLLGYFTCSESSGCLRPSQNAFQAGCQAPLHTRCRTETHFTSNEIKFILNCTLNDSWLSSSTPHQVPDWKNRGVWLEVCTIEVK